jgi:uncharacterized protein (DUF486 family)
MEVSQERTMSVILKTSLLLTLSNIFMTFAWYAHLKKLNDQKWYIAALMSWGIALFEYLLQVPANRIWLHPIKVTPIEDSTRGYHASRFRAVRHLLHAPASEA